MVYVGEFKEQKPKTKMGEGEGRHTNSTLRQPRHCLQIIPPEMIIIDVDFTIIVDVAHDAVQLERGLDETRQPEHEEDEAADDDDAGKEEALRGEDQDQDDEEDAKSAGDGHIGEEPVGDQSRHLVSCLDGEGCIVHWLGERTMVSRALVRIARP